MLKFVNHRYRFLPQTCSMYAITHSTPLVRKLVWSSNNGCDVLDRLTKTHADTHSITSCPLKATAPCSNKNSSPFNYGSRTPHTECVCDVVARFSHASQFVRQPGSVLVRAPPLNYGLIKKREGRARGLWVLSSAVSWTCCRPVFVCARESVAPPSFFFYFAHVWICKLHLCTLHALLLFMLGRTL